MKTSGIRSAFLSCCIALLLSACGGGGETAAISTPASGNNAGTIGNSSSSAVAAPAAIASDGPIAAFGSVYVNGNHFDVSTARITIDDNTATEQDLRVGQSAVVTGTAAVGNGLAVASAIEVRSTVIGAVSTVSTNANTFVVLGQTVKVGSATSFDTTITPADITGIKAGNLVRVHGVAAADGTITARRIDPAVASDGYLARGTVTSVNTTAKTFKINTLTVNYSSATLVNYATGAAPANGDSVRVKGTTYAAATTTLTATQVAKAPAPAATVANALAEREGLVTRFASLTDFDVAGQKVTTSSATVYYNGTSAEIGLNSNVEARGTVNAAGVLVAVAIDVHHNGLYGFTGPVSALARATTSLTVLGVSATVNSRTRLDDRSSARIRSFAYGDLRAGDYVFVAGYESPTGSGKIIATRLERLPTSTTVYVAGPFTALSAPQFKVLGVTVNTATATFYADRATTITSGSFYSQAPGRQVLVTGTGSAPVAASRVLLLPVDAD